MYPTPGNKLSPFGNRISKTLLTPCRRVGLSRKTKTPNSIQKFSQELKITSSSGKLPDQSLDVTPVNKKATKRKNSIGFNSSLEKYSKLDEVKTESNAKKSLSKCFSDKENKLDNKTKPLDPLVIEKTNNNVGEVKNESTTNSKNNIKIKNKKLKDLPKLKPIELKKENEQKLSNVIVETVAQIHTTTMKDDLNKSNTSLIDHDYFKPSTPQKNIEDSPINEPFLGFASDATTNSTNSSPMIRQYKNRILCDSDDNFNVSPTHKPKLKTHNRISSDSDEDYVVSPAKSKLRRNKKNRILFDSDEDSLSSSQNSKFEIKFEDKKILLKGNESFNSVETKMRVCKVDLSKLSKEHIKSYESSIEIVSDEEDLKYIKKKNKIPDEDVDFCPKNFTNKKDAFQTKLNSKTSPKSSISRNNSTHMEKKNSKSIISRFSSVTENEDDDAFTSTPNREKTEKKELIDKIKALESKMKVKRQKLDTLNRASLYKSKHNVEELKNLTQIWKQGCVLGLNQLLQKLQICGPTDMPTLLKNLHIPEDMVTRIFVNIPNSS